MPLHYQGKKIKDVYYQGRKIKEAWYQGRKVYTSTIIEVIPASASWSTSRDWLQGKLQEYCLDWPTVTEIPFEIDARNATSLAQLFANYRELRVAPKLHNTGNVTNIDAMFMRAVAITSVPAFDARSVSTATDTFNYTTELKDGNVHLMIPQGARPPSVKMSSYTGLTRFPWYYPDGTPAN